MRASRAPGHTCASRIGSRANRHRGCQFEADLVREMAPLEGARFHAGLVGPMDARPLDGARCSCEARLRVAILEPPVTDPGGRRFSEYNQRVFEGLFLSGSNRMCTGRPAGGKPVAYVCVAVVPTGIY